MSYTLPGGASPMTGGIDFSSAFGSAATGSAGGLGGGQWYTQIPQLLGAGANLVRSFGDDGSSGGDAFGYVPKYEDYDPEPVERATEKVNTEYEKMLTQIGGIFNDIAYLTGTNLPTAVDAFRQRYADYMEPASQRGYNMLFNYEPGQVGQTPIGDYSQKAVNQLFGTASRASALNRPEYMAQAIDPSTVTIDPAVYKSSFQPYKDEAKSQDMFDYTNAATQALMTAPKAPPREPVPDIPKEYKRGSIGDYYANSPDVDKLMKFGSYFDVA